MTTVQTFCLPTGPIESIPRDDPHSEVWRLLESVTDPEIPVVSLRDMGVLRAIRTNGSQLEVIITPTYSGCPAIEQMKDDIVQTLAQAKRTVNVMTEIFPVWSSDWLTQTAREKLQRYGIAPPHSVPTIEASCATEVVINFARNRSTHPKQDGVACPQCKSMNTTETSHFGSTACKALYRCLDCMEPFDYFKPY